MPGLRFVLQLDEACLATSSLGAIKQIIARFPGGEELVLAVGERRLLLGPLWGFDGSEAACRTLSEFGAVSHS